MLISEDADGVGGVACQMLLVIILMSFLVSVLVASYLCQSEHPYVQVLRGTCMYDMTRRHCNYRRSLRQLA